MNINRFIVRQFESIIVECLSDRDKKDFNVIKMISDVYL